MRSNLVSHIHENYLDEQSTFYRMSAVGQELLSTLDQRCTADIEEFAVDTAVLYGNLIKPAIEIVSFSAQIWADQGPRQLGIFLAYFLLSSKWLQVVMPSFGRLTAQQQDLEGVFRTTHAGVLRNGEEIAFHTGGPRERSRCDADYARIVSLKKSIFKKRAAMSFLDTTAVKHIGSLLSYEIMIPTLYLGRAGVVIGTEAERMAYLVAVRAPAFPSAPGDEPIPFAAFVPTVSHGFVHAHSTSLTPNVRSSGDAILRRAGKCARGTVSERVPGHHQAGGYVAAA